MSWPALRVPSPALNVPSPALIVPRPGMLTWLANVSDLSHPWCDAIAPSSVNKFPNKLAPKGHNNITRNPPFCSVASFLIVSVTLFFNKPDSSSDLTIFIISFISSLEVINVVAPDPNIFLWIAASVAATVNPNGIKMCYLIV